MAWVTATSGTCVSVFKPVYFGAAMPETGPLPREIYTDDALWWKHEHLHRRAMAASTWGGDPQSFERLEDEFFAEGLRAHCCALGAKGRIHARLLAAGGRGQRPLDRRC